VGSVSLHSTGCMRQSRSLFYGKGVGLGVECEGSSDAQQWIIRLLRCVGNPASMLHACGGTWCVGGGAVSMMHACGGRRDFI
jgi:hypothetical protein